MSTVNSYTSWQPLEEVIVGRTFTPQHFAFINDAQVYNQLAQILEETAEDLDNLQRTIETFGTVVRRPGLPDVHDFHQQQLNDRGAPLPPLTPRDWQITLGEKLLRVLPINLVNLCSIEPMIEKSLWSYSVKIKVTNSLKNC